MSIYPPTASISMEETTTLTLTNTLTEYDSIQWASSDATIASINSSTSSAAIIRGNSSGSAVIYAIAYLNGQAIDQASCALNVTSI